MKLRQSVLLLDPKSKSPRHSGRILLNGPESEWNRPVRTRISGGVALVN
jgi:hypothetical protein